MVEGGHVRAALIVVGLATLVLAGSAHATQLAGLKLVPRSAHPGAAVKLTGTWFAAAGEDVVDASSVHVWWGGEGAQLLAVAQPDAGGTFITEITVPPDAPSGPSLIVATQSVTNTAGVTFSAPGTPARAQLDVGDRTEVPQRRRLQAKAASAYSGGAIPGVMAMTALAGLALAAVGLRLLDGELQRREMIGRGKDAP